MHSPLFYGVHLIIPLALVLRLNTVGTVAQLYREIDKINNSGADNITIGRTQTEEVVERKGYLIPELAKCMPEKRTVRIGENSGDWYFPSCTRIERCGGCCGRDDVLSCQPSQIEIVNYQVLVLKYVGGDPPIQSKKEIVSVEKHVKCQCDCKLKAKDCNPLQSYNASKCECACTNNDEKEKCSYNSDIKYWKSDTCTCQCRKVRDCNTGYTFNKHTCSCEAVQRPRVRIGSSYGSDSRISLSQKNEYTILTDG